MTNRVILGRNDAGTFVARVSAPGYNVLTLTDLSKFQLHESFMGAAMLISGQVACPKGSAAITIMFTNLGFIPVCRIYGEFDQIGTGRYPTGTTSIRVLQDRLIFPANTGSFDTTYYYQVFTVPEQ